MIRITNCLSFNVLRLAVGCLAVPVLASDRPFGTMVVPANFPQSSPGDVETALLQAAKLEGNGSLIWDWAAEDATQTLDQLVPALRRHKLKSFVQLNPSPFGDLNFQRDVGGTSYTSPAVRQKYLDDVNHIASLRPDYLNIAAELNLLAVQNPIEYQAFKSIYQTAYQNVKAISPETQVGVSFHFDVFNHEQQASLMNDLGARDYVGFTSYPALGFYEQPRVAPDQMPTDYYQSIRDAFPDDPVLMSEIGWPSAGAGGEAEQADFVSHIPRLMSGVQPEMITWPLLHDVQLYSPTGFTAEQLLAIENFGLDVNELSLQWNSIGLRHQNGDAKLAWNRVLEMVDSFTTSGPAVSPYSGIPEPAAMGILFLASTLTLRTRRRAAGSSSAS